MSTAPVQPVPEGFHTLTPHLVCDGAADAIVTFDAALTRGGQRALEAGELRVDGRPYRATRAHTIVDHELLAHVVSHLLRHDPRRHIALARLARGRRITRGAGGLGQHGAEALDRAGERAAAWAPTRRSTTSSRCASSSPAACRAPT